MKWMIPFLLSCFMASSLVLSAASYRQSPHGAQSKEPIELSKQSQKPISPKTLSYVALGLSAAGLIMVWIPIVSLVGLIFAMVGLGLGVYLRKRMEKSWARQLAVSLGMLAVISVLIVFGLVLFF